MKPGGIWCDRTVKENETGYRRRISRYLSPGKGPAIRRVLAVVPHGPYDSRPGLVFRSGRPVGIRRQQFLFDALDGIFGPSQDEELFTGRGLQAFPQHPKNGVALAAVAPDGLPLLILILADVCCNGRC